MRCVRAILIFLLVGGALAGCGCTSERVKTGVSTSYQPTLKENVSYYPGGRIRERFTYYVDGAGHHVRHGIYHKYFEDGRVWQQFEYKDGLEDGELTEWSSEVGAKVRHGFWAHGEKTGLWQTWYDDGEKESEATYHDGRIIGTRTWWAPRNGKISRLETYDKDGYVAKEESWYTDLPENRSAKRFEGYCHKGQQHGTWTYWFPDGRVKAVGEWRNGKPWSGICGTMMPGLKGLAYGSLIFHEYKDGKDLGGAVLPPDAEQRPSGK